MSKKQVFLARLFSTVILWGLVLGAIISGSEAGVAAVICGLGIVGLSEYYAAFARKQIPVFRQVGIFGGVLVIFGTFATLSQMGHAVGGPFASRVYDFETAALLLCIVAVFVRQMFERTRETIALQTMAYTFFGIVYVAWLFSFCTKLLYLPPRDPSAHITGHWFILYLCVVSKFSDMGAYLTGSLIGKHPMIPHISPNKTWEGFCGAFVFSTGGSLLLGKLLSSQYAILNVPDLLVLGLGLGLTAVVGDLAESIFKRSLELKDSGRLLPGIGGALDLIDSILFTAPLLFFYLRLVKHLP